MMMIVADLTVLGSKKLYKVSYQIYSLTLVCTVAHVSDIYAESEADAVAQVLRENPLAENVKAVRA